MLMKIYIDEAGRGPLAGPLYVWVVLPLKKFFTKDFKDSKMLTAKRREELYAVILELAESGKILFASGNSTNTVIDEIWLTKSINHAIRKAIVVMAGHDKSYCSKRAKLAIEDLKWRVDKNWDSLLVIDGKYDFLLWKDLDIETETIVKGDQKNAYIAMASIVAKVERDRVMIQMAKRYPKYCFEKHKGYWTELHRKMIKKYGPCKIHRKLFLRNILWQKK